MKNLKFCISVVLDSNYEKYIPYFLFFIDKSHPDAYVKIFTLDKLNNSVRELVNAYDKCQLYENFFKNFPKGNQEVKSIRWLIPREFFEEFDYVYIGDVDMLICKEEQTILEKHKHHCEINNIPYSNCVRGGQSRFTGLHFFKVFEYYNNIDEIIEKKHKDIKNKKIILSNNYRNEHLLYDITKESKMNFPKKENSISVDSIGSHHGLHLGLWRHGGIHESNTKNNKSS
jgi:hypothetical protein